MNKPVPFLLLLLLLLLLLAITPAFGQQLPWIPFNWEGGSLADRHFDKYGITVPMTFDNVPHKFKMQFDLGATTTIVYGNIIAILGKIPGAQS